LHYEVDTIACKAASVVVYTHTQLLLKALVNINKLCTRFEEAKSEKVLTSIEQVVDIKHRLQLLVQYTSCMERVDPYRLCYISNNLYSNVKTRKQFEKYKIFKKMRLEDVPHEILSQDEYARLVALEKWEAANTNDSHSIGKGKRSSNKSDGKKASASTSESCIDRYRKFMKHVEESY
jgi:hypothetical protein